MGFQFRQLWSAPEINPYNKKARSIPIFNPVNKYGRVFFFSYLGFFIAFWSWYAFPPLLSLTIKKDLHLSQKEVANSNIVSLTATLIVRFISGPLCDKFGPRKVFVGCLLLGSIPSALAGTIHNAAGLYTIRFFVGILGSTFVPCQVWTTGFFDKNVVGTANALTGGFGNAGGGITYFIMPAVYDGFVHMGYSPGKSWRLTFIVPLVMVILCGVCLLLLCPDTPTGKWSDRHTHTHEALVIHGVEETSGVVNVPGAITDKASLDTEKRPASDSKDADLDKKDTFTVSSLPPTFDHEAQMTKEEMLVTAQGETVVKPTLSEAARVAVSPQTIFHVLTYMNSFGGELAINSILASYYFKNFPTLTQTTAANWAAMFGFLNFVTRPLGGIVSDLLYKYFGRSLWLKKAWIIVCGVITGIMLIIIGRLDPHDQSTMIGLVSLMSIFLEAGNGANFSLVPHVHPYANGILSGLTGAGGNMGGVIFAVIFRFMDGGANYAKAFWVMGCIQLGVSLAVSWIPPLPKGQIGGH